MGINLKKLHEPAVKNIQSFIGLLKEDLWNSPDYYERGSASGFSGVGAYLMTLTVSSSSSLRRSIKSPSDLHYL
jgi:hypothetical protein